MIEFLAVPVFVLVIIIIAIILREMEKRLGHADKAKPEPTPAQLVTEEAREILAVYDCLEEEFKRFPELHDNLRALDELNSARGSLYGQYGRTNIKHDYDCVSNYRRARGQGYTQTCHVCAPYKELKNAVRRLTTAQNERNEAIAKAKMDMKVDEINCRLSSYTGLAERMRAEAGIFDEVTKEVFND